MLSFLSSRRKILLIGVSWVALTLSCSWHAIGNEAWIGQKRLENSVELGQIVELAQWSKASHGTVCVLFPYQTEVNEDMLGAHQINLYLDSIDYKGYEHEWSLAAVTTEGVNLSRFDVSLRSDVLGSHNIGVYGRAMLPKNFKPVYCADLSRAAITKIKLFGRFYFILGEF